ncbi:MAG: hypothetical protein J6K73_16700 [Clostridia bacterium]|nr:hypothetical protein [Clostridia bacterium]MBP3651412.1 hypothetical protein [Clostridia bacterium]
MLRTIKKHPFAFLHCLCWVFMGLSIGYIMHGIHQNADTIPFANELLILYYASVILLVLFPIIGLIVKWIRRPAPAVWRERSLLHSFANRFERTQPGSGWRTVLLILAGLLFIPAFLSLTIEELYVNDIWFAAIGVGIWLCFEYYEWPENKLLKETDWPERFQLRNGACASLLNELYEQNHTHGIPMHLWDSRRVYLYNAMLQQGIIDERSSITGHVFSAAEVTEHFGIEQENPDTEDVVWITFDPLNRRTSGKGYAAIQHLFTYHLTALADRRYESNRETESSCYPYTSVDVRLQPDETIVLRKEADHLHLFTASASNTVSKSDWFYQGCMLRIEDAELADVKWDFFEAVNTPEDDREHYLSPEEAQSLYRLLLQDTFAYEICSLTYLEQKQQVALEVWLEPEDPSGLPLTGEAASFALDDGSVYLLILSYSQLRWHWMKATPKQEYHPFL